MAENNRNDNNSSQSSLFKTAAISAPIAIGGGIGVSRYMHKRSTHFSEPVNPLPSNQISDTIREFSNRYADPARSGVYKDWQLEKLAGMTENITLSTDQVRNSAMRAAKISDPTGATTQLFTSRLGLANTPGGLLQDLSKIVSQSSSLSVQRATSMFLEDISILNQKLESGVPIETQSLQSKVPRTFTKGMTLSQLSPTIRADVTKMAQLLGAGVKISSVGRADIPGGEYHFTFSESEKFPGQFTLRVPRTLPGQEGIVTRGTTQQSKYIAGTYGLIDQGMMTQSFTHEEWTMRRAVEDLVPQLTGQKVLSNREVRGMVSSFERSIMEPVEWVPSITPGEHAGIEEYIKQRSQIMRLYSAAEEGGVAPISERAYHQLMSQGGARLPEGGIKPLFPGFSPAQIAKGTVSTQDVRGAMSLVPEAAPYGRRPLQFLRPEGTPLSPELIKGDQLSRDYAWARASMGVDAPMMKAAYISSDLDPQFAGTGVSSEGQLLVSEARAGQRAVRQWKQFDIASDQMVELAGMIDKQSGGFWDINKQAAEGTFLGYDPSGRPVTLPEEMTLLHATAFEKDAAKGDFIRVMATKDVEQMPYSKVFGGAKGMAVEVDQDYIRNLLSDRAKAPWMANDIDTLITMDELKKNRGLHYNQMFTSLWDFTKQNIDSGKTSNVVAANFFNDPIKKINKLRAIATQGDKFSHESMMTGIMKLARHAKLDPQQMGMVFGAVPDVFGDMDVLGSISAAERKEIGRGIATGTTQLWFGGLGGPGAGGTATIEPRAFELMGAPHFGSLGPKIQTDIAERMAAAYPERFLEQKELMTALESVTDLKGREGALPASQIAREGLPSAPASMAIPGMGDIYIPGTERISKLAGFETPADKTVFHPLAQKYQEVADAAAKLETGDISQKAMRGKLAGLEKELLGATVGTVTGKGGLLRNRVPGSVFATAVQPTLESDLPEGVVGITKPMAKKMFGEMERLGIYQKEQLKALEDILMAGGRISGVVGRHPYIGQYSSQAADLKLIQGSEPIAMMHEKVQKAITMKGRLADEAKEKFRQNAEQALQGDARALKKVQQMGGDLMSSPIRLSPFVGLAGDVDGDIVSVMMAGPRIESDVTAHTKDLGAQRIYEEFAIRSQVMKAKAGPSDITLRQMMAGDVTKLGITQGGRLGKLSTQLQQYRAATLSNIAGLSTREQSNAMWLLEWLEQTPISAKHIEGGREMEMLNLLDEMEISLSKKKAGDIAELTRQVLSRAKMEGQQALKGGFTIAMEDLPGGGLQTRFIDSIDLDKTTANLVNAQKAFEASSMGQASGAQIRKLILNRGGFSTGQEAVDVLKDAAQMDRSPFAGFFPGAEKKTFSEFAERSSTMLNRLAAAGRKIIPLARPLAMGTGAALGLAAVLSEPPKFEPPSMVTSNMKSGSGGEDLGYGEHPHKHQMGQPTAQTMESSQNSVRLAPEGYRVDVKGRADSALDMNSINSQMRGVMGPNSTVNSSIRDQRSSLTPQKIASILQNE